MGKGTRKINGRNESEVSMIKRTGYRQGEVGIVVCSKEEGRLFTGKPLMTNVIIEGEVSGHKHEVKNGKLYEKDSKMYLQAFDNCEVVHPEHKAIRVPKGLYEIRIQKEYKEDKAQKVKD